MLKKSKTGQVSLINNPQIKKGYFPRKKTSEITTTVVFAQLYKVKITGWQQKTETDQISADSQISNVFR